MSDRSSATRKPRSSNHSGTEGARSAPVSATTVSLVVLVGSFVLLTVFLPNERDCVDDIPPYNPVYPLSSPVKAGEWTRFRIAVITDLDLLSKVEKEKNTWQSYLRRGYLELSEGWDSARVAWDPESVVLKSTLSQGGRGMELSDLKVFDGYLLSVDDRTGVVYRIVNDTPIAWVLLADGDGWEAKGLKGEWMALKDKRLYVGGLGKEWTTIDGEFVNRNPMWVKVVTHSGHVSHVDWHKQYEALRAAVGITYPGYMIHESAQWSPIHKRWFFLPRRASKDKYTEKEDERRGTNLMIIADEDLNPVEVRHVGPLRHTRGFSAFQFVPGKRRGTNGSSK